MRWFRHLAANARVRRLFPARALAAIHAAIAAGERRHRGQVCFAIEQSLPWRALRAGHTPRDRAHEAFAQLRVWDTQHNSGVLIYVLVAEHAIEIVADRGIAARVPQSEWDAVCRAMEARFRKQEYLAGALEAINAVTRILERHFPARGANPNELPDRPAVL